MFLTPTISEESPELCQSISRTKLSAGAPVFVPTFMQVPHAQSAAACQQAWSSGNRQCSSASTAAESSSTWSTDFSSSAESEEDEADVNVLEEVEVESPVVAHSAAPHKQVSNELKISENSWAAALRLRRARTAEEGASHEEIVRKMKCILNKLTIEKFLSLSKQLISCGIRNNLHLKALITEILEKATMQHHFINMYADLCSVLHAHFAQNSANKDPNMNFKKILLDAVQAAFEQHVAAPVALKKLKGEELREAEQLYKMQMLGNIKFVGALLVRKMLAVPVMFAILDELLSDPSPEALESLAAFLTVIGPSFDQAEFKQQFILTAIFAQVETITKNSKFKNRVRCLLKDVLDLRASGWSDLKPKKLEGPSTLEEVAQKFQTEVEASSPTKRRSKSDWYQGSAGGFSRQSSEGFNRQVSEGFSRQVSGGFSRQSSEGFNRQVSAPCGFYRQSSEGFNRQVSEGFNRQVSGRKPEPKPETKPETKPKTRQVTLDVPVMATPIPEQSTANEQLDQGSPQLSDDLSSEELAAKVVEFIEANSLDEEAAEDLKACPAEVQKMVLSKGDVTSGRNPSAMLRVRINQSMRKLKINPKVVERRATKTVAKVSSPKAESSKSDEQAKKSQEAAAEVQFDKEAGNRELTQTYAELMVSHDIREAIARAAAVGVPPSMQPQAFCELLAFIVEKNCSTLRSIGFKFIVAIFAESCWCSTALQEGLRSFADMCEDLKLDVPALPKIMSEEMVVAFETLVGSGLVSAEELQALSSVC